MWLFGDQGLSGSITLNRNIFELQATFNIHDSMDDVEHSGGLKIFESNHKFREKKTLVQKCKGGGENFKAMSRKEL